MHRVLRGTRAIVRPSPFILLLLLLLAGTRDVSARPVRVIAFNVPVNVAYDARDNGANVRTIASSHAGSLGHTFDANDGDVVSFAPADLAPPPPPLIAAAVSDGAGCARVTWHASSDPTVVGYVVYAGTRSVASGEATGYERSVDAGSASSASLCLLPAGASYIAVRARNYAGVLSAYSAERAVTITTLAVLFRSFEATTHEHGVRLTWDVEADEVVQGYRVYRTEDGGPETLVADPLSPGTREFVDEGTRNAASYAYVLAAIREDGSEIRSARVTIVTPALALALGQNAPNPFNPVTQIPFTLDRASRVLLRVYDVRGALVATVYEGHLGEGRHTLPWQGEDDAGRPVASGIYVYALTADRRTLSKKMALLK